MNAGVTIVFTRMDASIGSIDIDAVVTETHLDEVEVTDHPVEIGVNISDHMRVKPAMITLDGLVSNTPLPAAGAPTTPMQAEDGVTYSTRSASQPARAGSAYQQLLALKTGGQLVTVVTALRSYDQMALVSLSVPRDAKTGNVLRFTAQLKEIRFASSQVAVISVPVNKNLGKKGAPETPENTRSKSLLKVIKDTGQVQKAAAALNNGFDTFMGHLP